MTVQDLGARRVVVVGDALLDRFTETHVERICREAPAPNVRLDAVRSCPGGAANTAANVAALGASVQLVSLVGDDPAGRQLRAAMAEAGVDVDAVLTVPGRATPQLDRLRADGRLLARVDQGSEGQPDAATGERLATLVEDLGAEADAVIVSDYGRGAAVDPVIDAVARLAATPRGPLVAVDARRLIRYRRVRPAVVKPNWAEAVGLLGYEVLGRAVRRDDAIARHAHRMLGLTGARIVAVTLDRDGAVVLERRRRPYRTTTRPTTDDRATGAGDTFLTALTLGLTSGLTTPAASELAARAAGVVVQEGFTTQCTAEALAAALDGATRTGRHRRVPAERAPMPGSVAASGIQAAAAGGT
jgi:D-beta-D-heptose 7-phosphate kinase/D-beta-D-heptose 1-phosphate adenosyltransferase